MRRRQMKARMARLARLEEQNALAEEKLAAETKNMSLRCLSMEQLRMMYRVKIEATELGKLEQEVAASLRKDDRSVYDSALETLHAFWRLYESGMPTNEIQEQLRPVQ